MAKQKNLPAVKSGVFEFAAESAYIGILRNKVLREHGLSRTAYEAFIERHLGKGYFRMQTDGEDAVSEEVSGIEMKGGYDRGFAFQQYIDSSSRASSASVYTPEPVAGYLVERAFYYIFEESFRNKGIQNPESEDFYASLGEFLWSFPERILRILDISAGTGLFLIKTLSVEERALKAFSVSDPEIEGYLLKQVNRGLVANDLHKEGLEIFLLNLLEKFLPSFEWSEIQTGIFTRDAVSDFEFEGPFDLIFGNPPYLGEKSNRQIFDRAKLSDFGKRHYEAKMDYFYYFIHKAIDLLQPGGTAAYVTTNYFTTADGGRKLRAYLKGQAVFREIFMLEDVKVFPSAKGQHNMLYILQKNPVPRKKTLVKIPKRTEKGLVGILKESEGYETEGDSIYDGDGNIVLYEDASHEILNEALKRNARGILGDLCQVRQGLVSGCDRTSRRNLPVGSSDLDLDESIFVFNSMEEIPQGLKDSPFLKPFYKNSDIGRYNLKDSRRVVLYITDDNLFEAGEIHARAVLNHLGRYREILSRRREVGKGVRKWYALQWYRTEELFTGPKLLVPHRAMENRFVYTERPCYGSADIYFIKGREAETDLKALCAYLNSNVVHFWLRVNGKKKGRQLELYHTPLERIPLPEMSAEAVKRLSMFHDCLDRDIGRVDDFIGGLYGLNRAEMEILQAFANQE